MKERRILTSQAKSGMVTAEDIYTYNNQLIISKNTMLTNRSITRLNFYSITDFKVFEKSEPQKTKKPSMSFTEEIKHTKEFKVFKQEHSNTVTSLKQNLDDFILKRKEHINVEEITNKTFQLISNSRNGNHTFHMIQCMRDYSDITYVHSVNVALISHTIGTWLGFNEQELQTLVLGGLLHDIGKLLVPQNIIDKPSSLSTLEYRIIKTHSQKGYEILKEQPLDIQIALCAYMHHERYDGSGYPNHLKGNDILDFASIISIADTYDAMTSSRVYRDSICPFDVINMYETEGLHKFKPDILLIFLKRMAESYIHNNVLLSNGQKGEIIMLNPVLSKPMIQVGENFIDLSKHSDLTISKII